MSQPSSNFKEELYQRLPELYRTKDNGDLKNYLFSVGSFMDQIYANLNQRLADNFPDNPALAPEDEIQNLACQEWLLPYFADLLDVELMAPHEEGKREEIANAIRWRQRKGTLSIIEDIAEKLTGIEVEVQEAWQRVVTTPRIDMPLRSVKDWGYKHEPASVPSLRARHPALPASTIDFRHPSAALKDEHFSGSKLTRFDNKQVWWRPVSLHGLPCHPQSFDDRSKRVVDLRTTSINGGYFHPKNILLFTPPDAGFFPSVVQTYNWDNLGSEVDVIHDPDRRVITYRNPSLDSQTFVPIKIRRIIELGGNGTEFDPDHYTYRFEGLHLDNSLIVHSGRIELYRCAVRKISVHSIDKQASVLKASNCLFKLLEVARGLVNLEYCSVLEKTLAQGLYASDCIFIDILHRDHHNDAPPEFGCVRFSRLSPKQLPGLPAFRTHQVSNEDVVFYSSTFGERSCAVLHSCADEFFLSGADMGGELGAYHDLFIVARQRTMLEKIKRYLPVGFKAVLIPDEQLLSSPAS